MHFTLPTCRPNFAEAARTTYKVQQACTRTRSAAAWPPRHLCHRPVTFFRQLRLTALSLPQGKTQRASKKCFHCNFFYFSKNWVTTKLRKWGTVSTHYRPIIRLYIHVGWERPSVSVIKSATHKEITNQTNTPPSDTHGKTRQPE